MLRNICLLITLISLSNKPAFSQNIQGVVASKNSRVPISYANVYYSGSNLTAYSGSFTDRNGSFEIESRSGSSDSLTVSCIGFATLRIHWKDFHADTIFLEESHTQLQDVTIIAKSAKEFLTECIKRIPENYKNASFHNTGFGWQVLKVNDVPQKLIRSFFKIEQEYLENVIHTQLTYDSISEIETDTTYKIIPSYENLNAQLYFDLIRNGPSILSSENLDAWNLNFSYNSNSISNVVVIEAKSKGNFNDYNFYINESDLAFLKIEYNYHWNNNVSNIILPANKRSNDSIRHSIDHVKGTILYEKTFQKYNLKYLFNEIKYTRATYDWSIPIGKDECTLLNELVVTNSKEYSSNETKIRPKQRVKRINYLPSIVEQKEYDSALQHLMPYH